MLCLLLLFLWKIGLLNQSVVADTLVKLMEYGEEDDDPEDSEESLRSRNSCVIAGRKPFWAV